MSYNFNSKLQIFAFLIVSFFINRTSFACETYENIYLISHEKIELLYQESNLTVSQYLIMEISDRAVYMEGMLRKLVDAYNAESKSSGNKILAEFATYLEKTYLVNKNTIIEETSKAREKMLIAIREAAEVNGNLTVVDVCKFHALERFKKEKE